jgi:DNA helicase-2/ATP-dependent DNA helicase PcrA
MPLLGNYRCPRRVVAVANAFVASNRDPDDSRPLPYSRVTDRDGQVLVSSLAPFADEPSHVADVVQRELDAGIPVDEIAILATVRFEFEKIREALARRGIPATIVGSEAFLSGPLSRLALAAFAAATGASPRALQRLSKLAGSIGDGEEHHKWVELVVAASNAEQILDLCRRQLSLPEDDPDYAYALEIIRLAQMDGHGSEGPLLPQLRIEWPRLDRQLRRNVESVKVMTTFGAKGLEFEAVILPYFDAFHTPYKRRGTRLTERWWREERRKTYVAFTRAKRRVIITFAGQPSEFLTLLPAAELQTYDSATVLE